MLAYARETVARPEPAARSRQRVRWWSALALLRALASSPAAAAATLRNRAEHRRHGHRRGGRRARPPRRPRPRRRRERRGHRRRSRRRRRGRGRPRAAEPPAPARPRPRGRRARRRRATRSSKRRSSSSRSSSTDGYNPIVFCRFIPTAEYVAEHLRAKLRRTSRSIAVTGTLPPPSARSASLALGDARAARARRDRLPERGHQPPGALRRGRPLRPLLEPDPPRAARGPRRPLRPAAETVRVLTYYGRNNPIDGIVLEVLLRKHQHDPRLASASRCPCRSTRTRRARGDPRGARPARPRRAALALRRCPTSSREARRASTSEWDAAAEREKRSRTDVRPADDQGRRGRARARRRRAPRSAPSADVARFVEHALRAARGDRLAAATRHDRPRRDPARAARRARPSARRRRCRRASSSPSTDGVDVPLAHAPARRGARRATSSTPRSTRSSASRSPRAAARCAPTRSRRRTTLLLVRMRFDVVTRRGEDERRLLAEEVSLARLRGRARAAPTGSTTSERSRAARRRARAATSPPTRRARSSSERRRRPRRAATRISTRSPHERGEALLDAHRRVREGARLKGVRYAVEPQLPVDVLGVYVLLPSPTL